ncbi:MAG: hypothetical protein AABM41_00260 [Chloroflexota bacterium]
MRAQLKLLPPAKPRLGLYLRPGRNDHTVFEQLLAEDRAVSGLVLDSRLYARQADLRDALIRNGVHAVLDTDFMEAATPGGSVLAGIADLPWAALVTSDPADMHGEVARKLANLVADRVTAGSFSAVLAPTHLLESASDAWFAVDRAVASALRAELDRRQLRDVAIFYPLAIPGTVLRDGTQRAIVIEALKSIEIDAVWLRIHPFGTTSAGPIALRGYIEACWDLHRVGVPLVAERSGTIGVALMAFGAVGGIESGITLGERFDARSLTGPRNPDAKPFSHAPRVYIQGIGAFLVRASADSLFQNRQMQAALACRDSACCRRGVIDMIKDPRRHFVLRRVGEVDRIGSAPADHRPGIYLEDFLRPATDLALRASRVLPELVPAHQRLESWRFTLGAIERAGIISVSDPAVGQRVHVPRSKPQSL